MATTTIRASCHCGQLIVTSTIPISSLPLDLYLCSCSTCRYFSGQIAISSVYLHYPIQVTGRSTKYATSAGPKGLERCFCPECGTFVYEDSADVQRIGLFGGALGQVEEGILKFKGVIYAGSTRDGGLCPWVGGEYPAFREDIGSEVIAAEDWENDLSLQHNGKDENSVHGECLCGGISFEVTRPNEKSYQLYSPYSDSIVPGYMGSEAQNPGRKTWWIREGRKYAAAVCACNDCRRSSGQDLVQWAFVPRYNILGTDGKEFDMSSGTLKSRTSSEGVRRYWCSICGASAFFTWDQRPDLIDISVGLLRSKTGSRAEDFLEWLTRISFVEQGNNRELVETIQSGLRRYHNSRKR